MRMATWLGVLAGAWVAAGAWAGEVGTMLKADELRAAPYRDARTVARLAGGDTLDILRQQGGWYQVRRGSQTGWVRMLSVRRGEARKGTPVAGLASLATGRAGTGKVVATTGVRGLNEEELKSASFDEAELRQMETHAVSRDEARRFAAQGQLKPIRLDYLAKPEGDGQ